MRIFALETDKQKIIKNFCHGDEQVVHMTYYHGLSFLFAILREIAITILLVVLGILAWIYSLPMGLSLIILGALWIVFVFFNVVKAYVDWYFDFIVVTTAKLILIDQTSFFRQEINPIHLDNIGSVTTETQFWNIFPFGTLHIHLKEGLSGKRIRKRYVPHATEVAAKIADAVTNFQQHEMDGLAKADATRAPGTPAPGPSSTGSLAPGQTPAPSQTPNQTQ